MSQIVTEVLEMKIGDAIKEGLHRKRMTQAELADYMRKSRSLISEWIRSKRTPGGDDLVNLAIYLNIVCDLFPGYQKIDEKTAQYTKSELEEMRQIRDENREYLEKIKQLHKEIMEASKDHQLQV